MQKNESFLCVCFYDIKHAVSMKCVTIKLHFSVTYFIKSRFSSCNKTFQFARRLTWAAVFTLSRRSIFFFNPIGCGERGQDFIRGLRGPRSPSLISAADEGISRVWNGHGDCSEATGPPAHSQPCQLSNRAGGDWRRPHSYRPPLPTPDHTVKGTVHQ